ncbi:hypothetical protein ACWFMH_19990 [Bacillus altitudinis]
MSTFTERRQCSALGVLKNVVDSVENMENSHERQWSCCWVEDSVA